ncbi:MAG: LysM peptidoglycan-binding domain-containing protein [Myxococcales bacterium]|nr:LysM peptidoglycan-binding domain-containing protein [Myxococcales bacterium]
MSATGGSPFAQEPSVRDTMRALQDNEAAPLPDVDAIERGETPAASVSFGRLNRKSKPAEAPDNVSTPPRDTPASVSRARLGGGDEEEEEEGYPSDYGSEASPEVTEVPELHQVTDGDTLWSLCGRYFGDPWRWPQLWALNPQVTNPHWIFTGDAIRLRPGAGGELPVSLAEDLSPARAAQSGAVRAIKLREAGMVATDDLRAAARISGSREEKIMLASGDSAYLAFPKTQRLVAGERYTVFTVDKGAPIKDPASGKVLGYLVRIHGDVVVNQIADETTGRGTLVDLTEPVERGYYVSKRVQAFKQVRPLASEVSLESKIVATFSPTFMLAEQDFVVLSRGRKDGLRVGNRSYVIRQGDGYRPLMEGWDTFDTKFPKEIVAELLVVDVREAAAVAWVSKSSKEIRVGEFTETRRGY